MAEERKLYSDPYEDDESAHSQNQRRQERIRTAFETWHKSLGDKVSKADEERMLGIRDAVQQGDRARAEQHLTAVQQESSWLYEELMKHPEISAIMRELSIMGF